MIRKVPGRLMHKGLSAGSTVRRVAVALVVVLFLVSGAVSAESAGNGTSGLGNTTTTGTIPPATLATTPPPPPGTLPLPPGPPPRLVLEEVTVDNLTCTVYGTAAPASPNVTVNTILWDWGDNTSPEYHSFPYSHRYRDPGTYTLSVTALQSDGMSATELAVLVMDRPAISATPTQAGNLSPGSQGPGVLVSPPVLTLLEPVIDGLNVTLNGNLNTGSPGATIRSVAIDWGDGISLQYPDLPATYRYPEPGIFTINVTGIQSDGLSSSKRITLDLNEETSAPPPGPATGSPPPGNQPMYLYILVTAVLAAVAVVAAQRFLHRRQEQTPDPEIPKNVSVQEEIYYDAKERGDMTTAAASAHICAQILRSLADESPQKHSIYLKMAEDWEKNSLDAGRSVLRGHLAEGAKILPGTMPTRTELEAMCEGTDVAPDVLESVLRVAVEIAREGREGQAVGTSFVVGDTDRVLSHSKQFVLNPFHGHGVGERRITDAGFAGNIKEFAQLDGAFLITGDGVVEAAGRYITVDMAQVHLPKGLGSRHSSVAGISMVTRSIGVVVSQSGGLITLFRDGKIVYSIRA